MSIARESIELAKSSLVNWRERYDKHTYSSKVVFNMFYRAYPYEWFWENRRQFFGNDMRGLQQPLATPDEAIDKIAGTLRKVQLENVHPFMPQWMEKKKDVGVLSHGILDPLISAGERGDNKAIEELEYTFCYNNVVYRCLNVFFAGGSIGLGPVDSFTEATGAVVSDTYLTTNLRDLWTVFQKILGQPINAEYSPLSHLY